MTTSISSEELLKTERRKKLGKQKVEKDSIKENKKSRNLSTTYKYFGKQKVEKESINENHETFQQLADTFTFMSFVA